MADTKNKFSILGSPTTALKRKIDEINTDGAQQDSPTTKLRKKIQSDFDDIEANKLEFKNIENIVTDNSDSENTDMASDIKFIKESIVVVNNNFNILNTNLDYVKTSIEEKIKNITETAKENKTRSKENEVKIELNSAAIIKHSGAISSLEKENDMLKEKLIKLDSNFRQNQLIIDGIQDAEAESGLDLYNKVMHELSYIMGEDAYKIPVNFLERLGHYTGTAKPRGIVIHFTCISDCEMLLKNKFNLRKGVIIRQNFPLEIEERRSKLVPILKKAQSLPTYRKKAKLVGDKLIIKSETYSIAPLKNLDKLPEELNPVNACQNRSDEALAFFGYASPFSNFHDSIFTINGKDYNNVEQYIQSKKAEMFEDEIAYQQIMLTKAPAQIKQLGKRIRNFNIDRWKASAKEICLTGIKAKFQQNTELRRKLLETGTRLIGEATFDKYWGTGIPLNTSNTLMTSTWTGQNVTGEALMETRKALRS